MTTDSAVFSVERDGHVATLWLDSPDRRNAMGPDFFADLPGIMAELSDDDDVRAVVLAAKGPAFTVGLDLKTMGGGLAGGDGNTSKASGARRLYKNVHRLQQAMSAVAECLKPVVAAVHGW